LNVSAAYWAHEEKVPGHRAADPVGSNHSRAPDVAGSAWHFAPVANALTSVLDDVRSY